MKETDTRTGPHVPELRRILTRSCVSLIGMAIILFVAIEASLGHFTRATIFDHSGKGAADWVRETVVTLPEFDRLVETGEATSEQAEILEERFEHSDVFLMEVFDGDGVLLFIADGSGMLASVAGGEVNEEARNVASSGDLRMSIDDEGGAGFPETYVSAYVPFFRNGEVVWVVEAYLDESALAGSLRRALEVYAVYLLVGGFLAFLLPSFLLAWRTSQLRMRDRELVELSRRDELTGLANRTHVEMAFENLLQKNADGKDSYLFYLDIDRFKTINDTIGHEAGDRILVHVATALSSVTRGTDLAIRFGGDEFIVAARLLNDAAATKFAERILAAVAQPVKIFGQTFVASISVGGYKVLPTDDLDAALRAADAALYVAKKTGRGRFVMHSNRLDRERERRDQIERRLREAIETDAFYLVYQPIYCGRAEKLLGFEALLRLQDLDGRNIPPLDFIPIAEEAGLIREMGRLVLRRALTTAATWPDDIFVAVNVSTLQFGDGSLAPVVERELQRSGVSPARLELELTESVFLDDIDGPATEIADLKALGVTLALDDFGTGFSSLAYLWRFPFDKLKIDRAFLEGFEFDSEKYREFIATIVLLGHRLDMRVTAEGLETTDQLAMLEVVGVEEYQGFLLGRPLPEVVATDYAHRRPPPALMVLDEIDDMSDAQAFIAG